MSLGQPFYIEKRVLPENHLDLNGLWDFCYTETPTDEPCKLTFEYSGQVPHATYFNVYEAGILPHPYKDCNSRQYRFVDQRVWYYRRTFSLADYKDLGRAFLCFDGAGYFSRVWLNGELLGEHEGLFGGPITEVNGYLKFGQENELIVEITSCNYGIPDEEWADIYRSPDNKFLVPWNMVKDSGTSNGDFSTMGIYRDVRLEIVPPLHISRPYLTTESIGEDFALLHLSVEIVPQDLEELKMVSNDCNGGSGYVYGYCDGMNTVYTDKEVEIEISLTEKKSGTTVYKTTQTQRLYDSDKVGINPKYKESQFFEKDICIKNPKLWYPVGLGNPELYDVQITLFSDGKMLDRQAFDFGIREFKLEKTAGVRMRARWGKFQAVINGKRFFIKGMNWTPLDQVLNLDERDYRWALELIRNQNVQLIRVWGAGNAPEHDIFYKICDELGILVWQDSFISNNSNPAWDKVLFQRQQSMYLYRLRNHPSLVIHCSGNENNPYDKTNACVWVWQYETEDIDPSRIRIRTTPDKGIAHIYHGFEPCWYRKLYKQLPLIGEAGTHSFPNAKTFRQLLSAKEYETVIGDFSSEKMTVSHKGLVNHITENDSWGMLKKIPALSHMCDTKNVTVSTLCECSGISSYEYYQFMVQAMREQYPVTGGVIPWVFKRPWATVAVQMVDGLGDPIAPYYAVKNSYNELEVHLALKELTWAVGERVELDARIINETHQSHDVFVKIEVYDPDFNRTFEFGKDLKLSADDYQTQISCEDFIIPKEYNNKFFFARAALYENEKQVSQSMYWPVVLDLMQDSALREQRRSANCSALTHENGPWLMTQIKNVKNRAKLSITADGVCRKGDRIYGEFTVENRSGAPAFPVHISFDNDGFVQCLDDDYFFMESDSVRKIKFIVRNDQMSDEKLTVILSAWNSDTVTIEV